MKFTRIHLLSYLCVSIVTSMLCAPAISQDVKSVVVAKVTQADVRSGQRVVGTVKPLRTSTCLLYTSPSPRDATLSRMPSSA